MEETGDDLRLERQLCFALSVASRSVVGAYKPVLAPLGLTHPQYLVMLALWEDSPQTVKDISAALLLEPATLSPLLKRLESAGLVSRARAQNDERALAIGLTPSGIALRQRALSIPATMAARLGLSRGDVQALHAAMTSMTSATLSPSGLGGHPPTAETMEP
ncbi:MarR family winged helix-turn-helix transcriptional regulator [Arthrobacter sp. H14-L1]|uniref:MarR family winged helix-turn-helix transcriptional regulator n=1 Tax=Arthrobacter sp. H14-L1 TaxID=2996697 RepID=UPI00226E68AE|nr:MarR family transcriptional regulator [Arthrobacter sp. H14-L1]MCY0904065.1 MarR family transcriptional regulator [Arthrobacter sp. H14-L1]